MPSKRTKATDISKDVRIAVINRDTPTTLPQCIFCGSVYNLQIAHFIPRSAGGLGIKENLACACLVCHSKLDQSTYRKPMLVQFERYLRRCYPDWNQDKLKYKKGE